VLTWIEHLPDGESFNGLVGNRSNYENALGSTGSPTSVAERLCHCKILLRRLRFEITVTADCKESCQNRKISNSHSRSMTEKTSLIRAGQSPRRTRAGHDIVVDVPEADRSVAGWGEQDRPIWIILSLETPLTLLSTLLSIRKITYDDIVLPPTSRIRAQASSLRIDSRVSIQPTSTCADLH
jgi:hypothetical protein